MSLLCFLRYNSYPSEIVCAIASKFYTHRPELHARLAELAQKLAFTVPARGYKSLEIVQAYLLLTLWGCGAVERYEYDKTWLLLGMAIRLVPSVASLFFLTWPFKDGYRLEFAPQNGGDEP